jgi:hypothetical protein
MSIYFQISILVSFLIALGAHILFKKQKKKASVQPTSSVNNREIKSEEKLDYTVGSDVDYEDLLADIGFNNQLVAILSQEEGFDNLRITLYPHPKGGNWEFKLEDFINIIEKAKNRLWGLQKITSDEEREMSSDEVQAINEEGQYQLDDILTHPQGSSKINRFGGMDYRRPDGAGVRFYEDGTFRGFLEP